MEKSSKKKIEKLFEQWSAEYLNEHEELLSFVPEQVHEQIEFVGNYLAAILIELPLNQHLAWAEQFFSLQRTGLDEDTLEIEFSGDVYDSYLYAGDVSDVDLSVVRELMGFEKITISRGDGKIWSKKDVQAMINDIRSDLEFDFDSVTLSHKTKEAVLQINCQIEGKE